MKAVDRQGAFKHGLQHGARTERLREKRAEARCQNRAGTTAARRAQSLSIPAVIKHKKESAAEDLLGIPNVQAPVVSVESGAITGSKLEEVLLSDMEGPKARAAQFEFDFGALPDDFTASTSSTGEIISNTSAPIPPSYNLRESAVDPADMVSSTGTTQHSEEPLESEEGVIGSKNGSTNATSILGTSEVKHKSDEDLSTGSQKNAGADNEDDFLANYINAITASPACHVRADGTRASPRSSPKPMAQSPRRSPRLQKSGVHQAKS
jgi:hypothetical protein